MVAAVIADLSPTGLAAVGPVLVVIGVAHFLTTERWYDLLSPRWRHRRMSRASASVNRWVGAGFLIVIELAALVAGIAGLT